MSTSKNENQSSWSKLAEPEMLAALSAVVVGICALIISIVQVQIMREEQHTSVWPRLYVEQHYAEGRYLRLLLVNRGIGPAVIRDVRATIDGIPKTNWTEIIETLAPDHPPRDLLLTSINGRILPAGDAITVFSTADTAFVEVMADQIERLMLTTCYSSVYEQYWSLTREFEQGLPSEPVNVRSCPESDPDSFVD